MWGFEHNADLTSGQIEAVGWFACYRWCEMAWGGSRSPGVLSVGVSHIFTCCIYSLAYIWVSLCMSVSGGRFKIPKGF